MYLVALFLLLGLIYSGSFQGQILIWDDVFHLLNNPSFKTFSFDDFLNLWLHVNDHLFMPAVNSVWFLLGASSGGEWNLLLLHIVNLTFHFLCSVLVYCLILYFLKDQKTANPNLSRRYQIIAWMGALIFAIHPIHVESVAWISGLKETLSCFFGLLSLLLFQSTNHRKTIFSKYAVLLFSLLFFALSMTSKPSFAILPICFLILNWNSMVVDRKNLLIQVVPFFVLSVILSFVTVQAQTPHLLLFVPSFFERILIAADSIVFYFVKIILPIGFAPDYGHFPQLVLQNAKMSWWPIVAVVAFITILIWNIKTSRKALMIFALFSLSLAPVSGIVPFYFQQISTTADRYAYFPLFWLILGFCYFLQSSIDYFEKRNRPINFKNTIKILGAGAFIFLSLQSTHLVSHWQNDEVFFQWMYDQNPKSFNALNMLGLLQHRKGHFSEAIDFYQKSLALAPWQFFPAIKMGYALLDLGKIDQVQRLLQELQVKYPTLPETTDYQKLKEAYDSASQTRR